MHTNQITSNKLLYEVYTNNFVITSNKQISNLPQPLPSLPFNNLQGRVTKNGQDKERLEAEKLLEKEFFLSENYKEKNVITLTRLLKNLTDCSELKIMSTANGSFKLLNSHKLNEKDLFKLIYHNIDISNLDIGDDYLWVDILGNDEMGNWTINLSNVPPKCFLPKEWGKRLVNGIENFVYPLGKPKGIFVCQGQVKILKGKGSLYTTGLGPCHAIALHDSKNAVGALAHVSNFNKQRFENLNSALNIMEKLGADRSAISIDIIGGAKYSLKYYLMIKNWALQNGLFIRQTHLGDCEDGRPHCITLTMPEGDITGWLDNVPKAENEDEEARAVLACTKEGNLDIHLCPFDQAN